MTFRRPTHQEVSARAYQLFIERGRVEGHAVDDWWQTEYELMQLPVRMLAEIEPQEEAPRGKQRKRSIIDLVHAAMY